jgi:hypothetical protein
MNVSSAAVACDREYRVHERMGHGRNRWFHFHACALGAVTPRLAEAPARDGLPQLQRSARRAAPRGPAVTTHSNIPTDIQRVHVRFSVDLIAETHSSRRPLAALSFRSELLD